MTADKTLKKIALILAGLYVDDLTAGELAIIEILQKGDYVELSEDGYIMANFDCFFGDAQ